MRSERIQSSFFKNNRSRLGKNIPPGSLVIVCSNHQMPRNGDQYFPYRQHSDFYYLTGITQEESILIVVPDHPDPEFREQLLIIKPSPKMEIWEGHKLSMSEATKFSGIETVRWIDEFEKVISGLINHVENLYFNFPENPKFNPRVKPLDYIIAKEIENKFPGYNRGRLAPVMSRLRMFKEPEEIEAIRHACLLTGNAFNRILRFVRPGRMEYEVEAEITHEFIRSGAEGNAYEPIIACGKNSLILHYVENNCKCRSGEMLLMDFGAEYQNYAADLTRTIPISGRFTDRQREVYDSVLKILCEAISLLTVGKNLTEYHAEVGLISEEEHLKLGLYTLKEVKNQDPEYPKWKEFFIHGTSHAIGLDVHDSFDRSVSLAPGMVLSCEPAIYIPGENMGIRLENDILITEEGPIDLMSHIPVDPEEIEDLMNRS